MGTTCPQLNMIILGETVLESCTILNTRGTAHILLMVQCIARHVEWFDLLHAKVAIVLVKNTVYLMEGSNYNRPMARKVTPWRNRLSCTCFLVIATSPAACIQLH